MSAVRAPIVLVGMMGAGKSTVGRALAERLRLPFLDSDVMVEDSSGTSIPALWAARGEREFRRLESRALVRALGEAEDVGAVIAAGGGCVTDEANRRLLRERGWVVWLRASPETLAARVGDGDGRPLLAADVGVTVSDLVEERRELYADVASIVVDVDAMTPEEVVERVLAGIA